MNSQYDIAGKFLNIAGINFVSGLFGSLTVGLKQYLFNIIYIVTYNTI